MIYTIIFRPTVRIIGPPGDGRLAELFLELIKAGRIEKDRTQYLQEAQDHLIAAGVPEEQVFEVTRLILCALHPREFSSRVLPKSYELEVKNEKVVA